MKPTTSSLPSLSKSLIILALGVALASVFAWIVYDGSRMETSVLSLQERARMRDLHRDAAYKKVDHTLEVFISESLQSSDQLFISLLHNPTELILETWAITSPYQWEIIKTTPTQLLLKVTGFQVGDLDEGIVIVPYQWDDEELTLEFVSPKEQWGDGVAVGKL